VRAACPGADGSAPECVCRGSGFENLEISSQVQQASGGLSCALGGGRPVIALAVVAIYPCWPMGAGGVTPFCTLLAS
jgi:hypothetical protein